MSNKVLYQGGCHCGAVRFEVQAPAAVEIDECNCSICAKSGFLHLIVSARDFQLLKGEQDLSLYTFNTHMAKHHFCKSCGVKSFYIPRSNPDGVSVKLRCLDQQPQCVNITRFNGLNWEANANSLAHKSKTD